MNPIVVAVDFTPASVRAFATAVDLAGRLETEVVVIFVQSLTDLRFALQIGIQIKMKSTTGIRQSVQSYLDKKFRILFKSAKAYSRIRTVIRKGEPWVEIVQLAKNLKAQLIVAGTRGRSNTIGLILGSTAQQLIRSASCPVMVVRAK